MADLPPPRGFFAALLTLLEHPWTAPLALLVVALAAVLGIGDEGTALAGPWPQIALAFAGFALLARGWRGHRLLPAVLFTGGLAVAAVGGLLANRGLGELSLGAAPVEAYARSSGERALSTHLGAALQRLPGDGVNLRLAVKDREVGRGPLPLDGSAALTLGPWTLRALDREPAGEGTHVRLKVTPRAGGEATSLRLAVGEGAALAGDVRLDVVQISGDFGRALGPAARLALKWPEGEATDWHFVEAPDLDARLGTAPVAVVVEAVEAEAPVRVAVARAGIPGVLAAGLGLMVVGLLLALRRKGGAP